MTTVRGSVSMSMIRPLLSGEMYGTGRTDHGRLHDPFLIKNNEGPDARDQSTRFGPVRSTHVCWALIRAYYRVIAAPALP
jgi:hypothetical protein